MRCSYIYKKNTLSDDACPMCGTFDAVDIQRGKCLTAHKLRQDYTNYSLIEFQKFMRMNLSIWKSLCKVTWNGANEKEDVFSFLQGFEVASGEATASETRY